MAIPATVIYFTVYDQLREYLNKSLKLTNQPLWVPVVSGGFARIFAATTISPLEMIRTKMQSKRLSYLEVRFQTNSRQTRVKRAIFCVKFTDKTA